MKAQHIPAIGEQVVVYIDSVGGQQQIAGSFGDYDEQWVVVTRARKEYVLPISRILYIEVRKERHAQLVP